MVARARWGAGLLALVLSTGVVSFTAPVHAAEPVPTAIWDSKGAAVAARDGGKRVEVTSMRSETTQVFANPDGTWTSEEFAEPVRTRGRDGAWSEIDTTLVAGPDGTVRPKSTVVDVEFSGGGNNLLAKTLRAGGEASVGWNTTLPKPALSGSTATYSEVLPGVDLVLTAEAAGYSKVLIVKNKQAAAHPKLKELAFNLSTKGGLKWNTAGGTLKAVDAQGDAVLGSSQPVMWDSSSNESATAAAGGRPVSDVHGPAAGAKRAQLPLTVSEGRAAIKPDAALLSGSDTVFPLYIDPAYSMAAWTMINGLAPTQSYWNFDKKDCPSGFSTECAKVGYYPDGNQTKYRSLFQFSGTSYKGKHVLGSKFTIDLLFSSSSAASVTELWKSNSTLGSGTTWNNNASTWATKLATVSNSSWPAARKATSFASTTLTSNVTTAASTGATLTFGLRATDEASQAGWKKYDAKTARLVVDYNSFPGVSTAPTVEGRGVENPRPVVGTATPELRVKVTDTEAETDLIGKFEWEKFAPATSTWAALGSGSQTGLRKDATAVVKIGSGLVDGGIYRIRARAEDPWSYAGSSGTDVSAWTGWVEFEVDSDGPKIAPLVASPDYGTDPNQSYGSIGKTGTFTFNPNGVVDTAGFKWGWTDQPTVDAPAALGQPTTLQITPPAPKPDRPWEGGELILSVQSYDRAGRTGPLTRYKFTVGNGTGPIGKWNLDQAAGATSASDTSGNGRNATITGATSGSEGRLLHPTAPTSTRFDGDDQIATTSPVVDTGKSFTTAVWVRTSDITENRTVVAFDGVNNSAFFVEQINGKWGIGYKESDTGGSGSGWAADVPVRINIWTHLVAVFDLQDKKLRLYIDGVLASTLAVTASYSAAGPLAVGRFRNSASTTVEFWKGDIADVMVWDRVLNQQEVSPMPATPMGEWRLDSAGNDESEWGNGTTSNGGVSWTPDQDENPDAAAALDGTGWLETVAPVLLTDQSYSVAGWVRPTEVPTGAEPWGVAFSQGNDSNGAFMLYYEWGKWNLTFRHADGTTYTNLQSTTHHPVTGGWAHVAAVYDAAAGQVRLYVGGVLQSSDAFTQSWASTLPFQIGRSKYGGQWTGNWNGAIDDVRAFQGVLHESEIKKLAS